MDIGHPTEIAQRLKAERERLGLTLLAMAEAAEVGRATQANYEAAVTHPGVDYMYRLKGIGVDTHYVLTGVKACDLINAEHPDFLWMAAEAARALKEKVKESPTSDRGMGLLLLKFYRVYSGENNALATTMEGLVPAKEGSGHD